MATLECDTKRKFDPEKVRQRIEAIEDGTSPWPSVPSSGPSAGPEVIRAAQERSARPARTLASVDSRRFSLTIRFLFSIFVTAVLAWLETAAVMGYPMPGPIAASDHPYVFLVVDTGLLVLAAALCGPGVLRGFASLFTFRADIDGVPALAFLGALTAMAGHLAVPQSFVSGSRVMGSAAAAAVCSVYLLGRLMRLRRVRHTAGALGGSAAYYTLRRVPVAGGDADRPDHLAACPVRTGEPEQVLGGRPAATPAGQVARVMEPAVLLAALCVLGLNLWLRRGAAESVTAFGVVCSLGAPAIYPLCQELPLLRTSHRLRRRHAALTGYAAVKEFQNADLIVVDASMLFPPEYSHIYGIKTFSGARIEEAIVDTASVVIAVEGPLAKAFRSLIHDSDFHLLTPERVVYREDQGICATMGGKEIVAGSRDILRSCGIQAPPREYEAKYVSMGRDLFYLAENGQLMAMFIVEYGTGAKTVSAFHRLMRAGVSMLVRTSDANITASMIAERFGGHMKGVQMLGGADTIALSRAAAADPSPVSLFFDGTLRSYADTLLACVRLRGTITTAALVQAAAALAGIVLTVWLSLHGGVTSVTPVKLLEYQGLWAVPSLLIALLRLS